MLKFIVKNEIGMKGEIQVFLNDENYYSKTNPIIMSI